MELKNIIENLSLDESTLNTVMEIAKPFLGGLLKIDEESFDTILALIPKLIAGEIDFKKLLKLALPFAISYFSSALQTKKSTEQSSSVDTQSNEELSEDLKKIAPEAFSQLSVFLQNANAS